MRIRLFQSTSNSARQEAGPQKIAYLAVGLLCQWHSCSSSQIVLSRAPCPSCSCGEPKTCAHAAGPACDTPPFRPGYPKAVNGRKRIQDILLIWLKSSALLVSSEGCSGEVCIHLYFLLMGLAHDSISCPPKRQIRQFFKDSKWTHIQIQKRQLDTHSAAGLDPGLDRRHNACLLLRVEQPLVQLQALHHIHRLWAAAFRLVHILEEEVLLAPHLHHNSDIDQLLKSHLLSQACLCIPPVRYRHVQQVELLPQGPVNDNNS